MTGEYVVPFIIPSKPPTLCMMVGLQGSGKTTSAVKIAKRIQNAHNPLVVACDLRRPAAIEQLKVLAQQSKVAFYGPSGGTQDVIKVAKEALAYAEEHLNDVIIFDTAGRLHGDEGLMDELSRLTDLVHPQRSWVLVTG